MTNEKRSRWLVTIALMLTELCASSCSKESEHPAASAMTQSPRLRDLIKTIDDDVNINHIEFTPSVHELIDMGSEVYPAMLDLMRDPGSLTRLHAKTVLYYSVAGLFGYNLSSGWATPSGEARFFGFWVKLGNLRHDGSERDRERSIVLWKKWIDQKMPLEG